MIIRHLDMNDYTQYTRLINTNITEGEYVNFIQTILSNKHIIVVMEVDGNIVGTGTLLIEAKMTNSLCFLGHIENIYIDENNRNKSFGKNIIKFLIEYSTKFGCYRIDLLCIDELCDYYGKYGFRKLNGMRMLIEHNYK
jgi:predicted GNAT family N-acyltransferase